MKHLVMTKVVVLLFFLDKEQNSYIEFKCEGNNVYHGFHVDVEDESDRVSMTVRRKIGKVL